MRLTAAFPTFVPLAFVACNAIIGLDEGKPKGGAGGSAPSSSSTKQTVASSSHASSAASMGGASSTGGAGGFGAGCPIIFATPLGHDTCSLSDPSCVKTSAFQNLSAMAGAALTTLRLDRRADGSAPANGELLQGDEWLISAGWIFGTTTAFAKLGFTSDPLGGVGQLGVTALCGDQPCTPAALSGGALASNVAAIGLVVSGSAKIQVMNANGSPAVQVDTNNDLEIVTLQDPARFNGFQIDWKGAGMLLEIYLVPCP